MTTTTDMVALYAEIAPAFIQFLQREQSAIQAEMARFKEEEGGTAVANLPEPSPSTPEEETRFDPTIH